MVQDIVAGADGNIWVAAQRRNQWATAVRMLRVTPDGAVTPFPLGLPPDAYVPAATAGPDGNVWFAIHRASRVAPEPAGIGRITPTGQVTTFSTGAYFYNPRGIAAGPADGNLWMTDWGGDNVVRVTTSGQLTGRFSIRETGGKSPWDIVAGPDGNLWFTEHGSDRVARITPSGEITEFSAGMPAKAMPTEMTVGADGALWFAQPGSAWSDGPPRAVGRITTSGVVSQIPTRLLVGDVAAGADGNVYATGTWSHGERAIGALARISPAGGVTEIPIGPCSLPQDIAAGPDGNVWFVDENISGACPPFILDFSKRARVNRSGIARIGLRCDGGDITLPCRDVSFRMTAKVRSAARGNARGKRRSRYRTVTVGSARLSIGGSPQQIFGRVRVAQIKLTRAGRKLLAVSRGRSLRVQAHMTYGSAKKQREIKLVGPKHKKGPMRRTPKKRKVGT